jgi:large subunit ribosomal protein L5
MAHSVLQEKYINEVIPKLMEQRKYKNRMQVPKLEKIVINVGINAAAEKQAIEETVHEIRIVTGQKPIVTLSKKSISNFKLRKNQPVGVKVTMRGRMMYEFLERFVGTALPRIRDFRGVPARSFDGRGSYTLGVDDHTIFPEIEIDKIKRNIGMNITFVTSANTNDEAKALLTLLGMPFSDKKAAA